MFQDSTEEKTEPLEIEQKAEEALQLEEAKKEKNETGEPEAKPVTQKNAPGQKGEEEDQAEEAKTEEGQKAKEEDQTD